MNLLCGDEVTITVAFADDGDTIEDVKFSGRRCAISQAATSMLTSWSRGAAPARWRRVREDLLDEVGAPDAGPPMARSSAFHAQRRSREEGTPLPEEASDDEPRAEVGMAWVEVGSVEELPPGEMKLVRAGAVEVGVYNIDGELLALGDRCSHDDGPLCEGTGTRRRASSSARATGRTRHSHGRAAVAAGLRARGDVPRARGERHDRSRRSLMLDDRVRTVLSRLEEEDRREREAGLPAAQRPAR